MRFIRAFWGDLRADKEKYVSEIRKAARNRNLNEIVYVWGDENCDIIKSFKYNVVKMSSEPTEFGSDFVKDGTKFFLHKYAAMRKAIEEYGECVFLDWDCHQINTLDVGFYKSLKEQNNSFQIPLYSFPKDGYLEKEFHRWPNMPKKYKDFTINQYNGFLKHHYSFENDMIIPCSCFMYCSDVKILNEFIEIFDSTGGLIYSDEFVWYEWAKKRYPTLEEFIKNYEPLVCNAKYDWHYNQSSLNIKIRSLVNKNLYFIHE